MSESSMAEKAKTEWNKTSPEHREFAKKYLPLLPDGNADYTKLTCSNCTDCDTCEYRWDLYNTHGDCLAIK